MESSMSIGLRSIPPWVRAGAAGISGLLGATLLAIEELDDAWVISIPLGALVLAAVAAHGKSLGAQLFARAAWWSNLMLGLFLTIFGGGREATEGGVLAIGCGIALLLADQKQLSVATEQVGYRPAAYLGTLQLLMVLAIADMLSLLLFGIVSVDKNHESGGLTLLLGAALMAVGFAGLYALKLWGVLVTTGTAVALGGIAAAGLLELHEDLVAGVAALSVLQVTAAAPMLLSILRKKPLPRLPRLVTSVLRHATVVLFTGAAAVGMMMNGR
jgi:hypothetical protein